MHKFVIDNCKIECFIDGKKLATDGETTTFESAEYFGVANGEIVLTANGKDYSCPVSEATSLTLNRRKERNGSDILMLLHNGVPFLTAENSQHKLKFKLLEYIFDYITSFGFEVKAEKTCRSAERLSAEYFVSRVDGLTCTYYIDKHGELSDSNTGKRRETECSLIAENGYKIISGEEEILTANTDMIENVIISKGRNFNYATVSVGVKKRTGLFFSIHAYGGDKARELECATVGVLGDEFRLDRRENCLFHRKEKRRKK